MVNYMGMIQNVSQKVKGKAQQIKGGIEIASGQKLKGNIDKLRGKANELDANLKMKTR
jgi:hypothetical protein